MKNKFWLRLGSGLLLLAAWTLPWQTKLILRPAASTYWEISLFAGLFLLWLAFLVLIPAGLWKRDFWSQLPLRWRWSASFFLIFTLASVFISPDKLLSFYRWLILASACFFFIFLKQCPPAWRRRLLTVLLASLAVQALIGLGQFFSQTSFASSYLGIAYHNAGDLGTAVIETAGGRWLRAYGASDHPNIFGGLMALAALGSLYFFCRSQEQKQRALSLGAYVLFLTAVLTSFSRAAVLAFILGGLVFAWENRARFRSCPRLAAALLVLTGVIIGLFGWQYRDLFFARSQKYNRLETISLEQRQVYNYRAGQDFKKQPWLGTGLGASPVFDREIDGRKGQEQPAWAYQPAHDYWLLAATESGVFTLIALIALWLGAYQKSRQRRLVGLFVLLFTLTLFDHWLFSLPLAAVWLVFLFALM